eukprot:5526987-Amphidinium_carterae.1
MPLEGAEKGALLSLGICQCVVNEDGHNQVEETKCNDQHHTHIDWYPHSSSSWWHSLARRPNVHNLLTLLARTLSVHTLGCRVSTRDTPQTPSQNHDGTWKL